MIAVRYLSPTEFCLAQQMTQVGRSHYATEMWYTDRGVTHRGSLNKQAASKPRQKSRTEQGFAGVRVLEINTGQKGGPRTLR